MTVNVIAFPHVNPKFFIQINQLLTPFSTERLQHANKNYWLESPHGDKASLCVEWDLGGNVSWTHLGDRSTVEWPLNSKTALFIWRLIDEAVIFIHSPPCQMEQIFVWPLFPSFSPHFSLFRANMQHHFGTEEASPDFVINNNGVIKLRAIFSSSVFFFLQCNGYSAIMSLPHCPHPVLISEPQCDTQATFDNEIRGRGWGEASNRGG